MIFYQRQHRLKIIGSNDMNLFSELNLPGNIYLAGASIVTATFQKQPVT